MAGGRQVVGIRIAAWIAIIAVVVYTVFVGAEASVVRAAVMGILVILAATRLGHPTFPGIRPKGRCSEVGRMWGRPC